MVEGVNVFWRGVGEGGVTFWEMKAGVILCGMCDRFIRADDCVSIE